MNGPRLLRAFRHASQLPEVWRCIRTLDDRGAVIAAYLGIRALEYPYEFRTPAGDIITLENFHDLVTAWILFYRREYRVDQSCQTIIDVGANVGMFTLLAAREAPASRIIALEPFPSTRARLEAHVARNGLADRVVCRPWALAGSDGSRVMDDDGALPSQSRGLFEAGTTHTGTPVVALSLATFWEREGIADADLLKLDIEGAGHELIAATPPEALRRAQAICLEYHPNGPKDELFAGFGERG